MDGRGRETHTHTQQTGPLTLLMVSNQFPQRLVRLVYTRNSGNDDDNNDVYVCSCGYYTRLAMPNIWLTTDWREEKRKKEVVEMLKLREEGERRQK